MIRINGIWTYSPGEILCPDRLEYAMLGEADNARGRVVRLLFRLFDLIWPVR